MKGFDAAAAAAAAKVSDGGHRPKEGKTLTVKAGDAQETWSRTVLTATPTTGRSAGVGKFDLEYIRLPSHY